MEDKIIAVLNEKGAMKAGELAATAQLDKDQVVKVIKKLVGEDKLYSPKRCFYDIKK